MCFPGFHSPTLSIYLQYCAELRLRHSERAVRDQAGGSLSTWPGCHSLLLEPEIKLIRVPHVVAVGWFSLVVSTVVRCSGRCFSRRPKKIVPDLSIRSHSRPCHKSMSPSKNRTSQAISPSVFKLTYVNPSIRSVPFVPFRTDG